MDTLRTTEIAAESRKPLTKKLLQPFAAITFFYEAARIALDELDLLLTNWNDTKDGTAALALCDSFRVLARSSAIHSEHVVDGLFPEIKELLNDRLRQRKLSETEKTELTAALSAMRALVAKHTQSNGTAHTIEQHCTRFVSTAEQNKEIKENVTMFETVSEEMKPWMTLFRQRMRAEVQFLALWLNELAQDKIDEIKVVRAIIDSNREEIVRDEFAFIVRKLSLCSESAHWTCPFSHFRFSRTELLAAYVGALQLTSTAHEYQCFLRLAPHCLPSEESDEWQQLSQYGLHQPGTFRYSAQVARSSLVDSCVHNGTCSQMESNSVCRLL